MAPTQQKDPLERNSNHRGSGAFKRDLYPDLDRHLDLLAMKARLGKSMPAEAQRELKQLTEELREPA